MAILLYDLAGAEDDRRLSPYCWRIKLALRHKGLEFDTRPWRFTEKDTLTELGHGSVPTVVFDDGVRSNSWEIAQHLESRWPDRPSLFGGPSGRALTAFHSDWADQVLQPALVRLVVLDVWKHLHQRDRDHFRSTREKLLGKTLEEAQAGREERVLDLRKQTLAPLRMVLGEQPFLGGEAPLYADYAVFGAFQWARTISDFPLLEKDDAIYAWRNRLLDLFDGFARKNRAYAV